MPVSVREDTLTASDLSHTYACGYTYTMHVSPGHYFGQVSVQLVFQISLFTLHTGKYDVYIYIYIYVYIYACIIYIYIYIYINDTYIHRDNHHKHNIAHACNVRISVV